MKYSINKIAGRVLAAALVPWSLVSYGAAATNLLENGGFEEMETGMPKGWLVAPNLAGKGDAGADSTVRHGGQRSLFLKPNSKNKADGFGVFASIDPKKIQNNDVTISGYVAVSGVGENPVGVLFKADRDNWILVSKETDGKFVPFTKSFSVKGDVAQAVLLLLIGGTKGQVWFDDVSVTIGSETNISSTPPPPIISEGSERINTPGWQDSVYISPDGRELYFAYMPYVQKDFVDIFMGKITEKEVVSRGPDRPGNHGRMQFETYASLRAANGSWGKPANLNINGQYNLYSAKLSPDGKELYYAIRDYEKNYGGDDIYFSRRNTDGAWSTPENLGPNINTRFREDTPCLSPDGQTLYFGRNQGETLGWEIYSSKKTKDGWTKPEKMPPPINVSRPEQSANYQPFMTADGKEFYFTRIQKLYCSKLQSDGTWGNPVPVLPQMEVSGHASVTADGKHLYFLTAANAESLRRHHWTIWVAERQSNGTWGNAKPVD